MGYTRYWKRTDKAYDEKFVDEVKAIFKECADKGIILKNGWGENEPVVNTDIISFNGNADTGLDHESCVIANTGTASFKTGFDFCKTARKPYDYAVRKVLAKANEYGLVIDVSSDGENDTIISDEDFLKGGF